MKTVIISLLAVLAMLPLDSFSQNSTQEQPQKKIALVIGNGNYSSSVLANPENDARSIASVLQQLGFTGRERSKDGAWQLRIILMYHFGLNARMELIFLSAAIPKEEDPFPDFS